MDRDLSISVDCVGGETSDQLVANFITYILEVVELLEREHDLTPANVKVTTLIERLKQQVTLQFSPDEIQAVLGNRQIQPLHPRLLAKLSECERHSELFYSRQLCQSHSLSLDRMTRLPSWGVYETLVGQEIQFIRKYTRQELIRTPIVFVGSGPMPLSAILIHLYTDVDVICLEMDDVAYNASRELLQRLGLENKVKVLHENGETFHYRAFRRVFVASLVSNKAAVLKQIKRTAHDPLVAVRTAEGMRQLIYESVDEEQLDQLGWVLMGRTSTEGSLVINSTLFMEQRE
ncbi:nicotianamine synthase family protein [Paenibacillus methanolicus]|uniref:Nicotianamine synthase-like protein n=1 Tax=Paenibacillus methanolicus TaxID=582686 RepID=A0A5S5C4Q1_9BACL|nr:nicotianamine synthase family protein [Paenibacillus methanolicus]TYP74119.1 nicotianamine synthase-like protein [Paenibacillus methanolicus]